MPVKSEHRVTEVQRIIAAMLTENTGQHMLDSGGIYGRAWERNQGRTVHSFIDEPAVTVDMSDVEYAEKIGETPTSHDVMYSLSVFHYLWPQLSLDARCRKFNKLNVGYEKRADDCPFYGVGTYAGNFLNRWDVKLKNTFNTYNYSSNLIQVLQGSHITIDEKAYVVLQIHGGCDVRGGYTDARLFLLDTEEGMLGLEDVFGSVDGLAVSNLYDGYSLTDEDGEPVPVSSKSKIELAIAEFG